MKILAIGDFHGKFPENLKQEAKKADLVLCTGDFGGDDELLHIIFKYFKKKWWKEIGPEKAKEYIMNDYNSGKRVIEELNNLGKNIYIVGGNWDFLNKKKSERTANLDLKKYQEIIKEKENLKYWNRGLKKINNLRILAFGRQVTARAYLEKNSIFSEEKRKKYQDNNKKETEQIMNYGNKNINIVLAHYTPYGYFDKVKFKGENPMNGKHVGFKGYTEFIKKYQPELFICGHMHEYQGKKKLGKTTILTTGAAKEGKGAMIDFDEKNKKVRNIRLIKQ